MKKFKYDVVIFFDKIELQQSLTSYGKEGWKFISIYEEKSSFGNEITYAIFEKQIEPV